MTGLRIRRLVVVHLAILWTCTVGAGHGVHQSKRSRFVRDTVIVVVRDDSTHAPIPCFDLAATRPRATGGAPWRTWGGFVDTASGTCRVGGVRGGVVLISLERPGYLEAHSYLT